MLGELTYVFILCVASLGLMMLTGMTGQVSLGHAAFVAIGAYAHAWLLAQGLPWPVSMVLAGLISALAGLLVGIPAIRVSGLYLAMVTMAFAIIVEQIIGHWSSVTGGFTGMAVADLQWMGVSFSGPRAFYAVCLGVTVLCTLGVLNLLRSATGRAWVAIRDSEISAQSMGIHLAYFKTLSFSVSAALAGVGGALYAHKMQFISPDQFGILQSIDLLLMVVIGGLGSVHGAFLGAIFLITMPQFITLGKDHLPAFIGQAPGLQSVVYGLVLIVFVMFEPMGLYGRWLKIRTWFELFPFYRKGMFKRQKSFQKSDRLK